MLGFILSAIDSDARRVVSEVMIILMTVISIAIIVIVMMQEGETGGVSAISGGSSDTFYGKNKGRSKEQILKRLTLILGAVMLVLSVVFFIIKPTAAWCTTNSKVQGASVAPVFLEEMEGIKIIAQNKKAYHDYIFNELKTFLTFDEKDIQLL